MTLLYLALTYLLGIVLGKLLWDWGWIGCAFPDWMWLLPLAWLPLTPLLNRLSVFTPPSLATLRWPVSAGFAPPHLRPSPGLIAACLLCLLTGLLRSAGLPLTPCWMPTDLAFYNLPADRAFDQEAPEATIIGYVSSYPLVADTKQRMQVIATTLIIEGVEQPVTGELRLSTGIRQRYAYGQPVHIEGRLVTPPDFVDFSYREYLARKGIHSLLYSARINLLDEPLAGSPLLRALYAFRTRGEILLNRLLPEPYAALANGMLLGIEAGIPDELYEKFNLTGSSHVIVISGRNVSQNG